MKRELKYFKKDWCLFQRYWGFFASYWFYKNTKERFCFAFHEKKKAVDPELEMKVLDRPAFSDIS